VIDSEIAAKTAEGLIKKGGRIDYNKVRKEGYSERLLAKLEQA